MTKVYHLTEEECSESVVIYVLSCSTDRSVSVLKS